MPCSLIFFKNACRSSKSYKSKRYWLEASRYNNLKNLKLILKKLVNDKVVGSIGKGVCVLLGIGSDDTDKDVDYMVNKILNIRVFDEQGVMWKKGVKDAGLELLCSKKE